VACGVVDGRRLYRRHVVAVQSREAPDMTFAEFFVTILGILLWQQWLYSFNRSSSITESRSSVCFAIKMRLAQAYVIAFASMFLISWTWWLT
jgi:hypothetical protein